MFALTLKNQRDISFIEWDKNVINGCKLNINFYLILKILPYLLLIIIKILQIRLKCLQMSTDSISLTYPQTDYYPKFSVWNSHEFIYIGTYGCFHIDYILFYIISHFILCHNLCSTCSPHYNTLIGYLSANTDSPT